MAKYKDSYLNIYHGPIRGGKTASMTADGAIEMINGRRCFSNYRVEFIYRGKEYSAEPLDTNELMLIDKPEFKKKYSDCVILWDEGALSMPALEFQSAQNKLTTQAMLLRGKLEANIYFSVQYLSMFAKNMRLQEDNLVFCHDLSFKYKTLERGSIISQAFQDISGRSTGETYEYSGMVYRQIFHAKTVWPIYDTKEMPVSIVRERIKMADVRDALGNSVIRDGSYEISQEEENEVIIHNLIQELITGEQFNVTKGIMKSMATQRGFQGKPADLGRVIMSQGVKMYGNGNWNLKHLADLV